MSVGPRRWKLCFDRFWHATLRERKTFSCSVLGPRGMSLIGLLNGLNGKAGGFAADSYSRSSCCSHVCSTEKFFRFFGWQVVFSFLSFRLLSVNLLTGLPSRGLCTSSARLKSRQIFVDEKQNVTRQGLSHGPSKHGKGTLKAWPIWILKAKELLKKRLKAKLFDGFSNIL